jgi:hypothetical protein
VKEQPASTANLAPRSSPRFALFAIALLCFLAYAPSLSVSLFEDDYGNLIQAQAYGPVAGLPRLMHDSVFRLRATSYWAMWLLWRAFHLTPWGYHLASLMLHIANAWLVYALAASSRQAESRRHGALPPNRFMRSRHSSWAAWPAFCVLRTLISGNLKRKLSDCRGA